MKFGDIICKERKYQKKFIKVLDRAPESVLE